MKTRIILLLTFFFSIVTMLAGNTGSASCSINSTDDGPITVLKTHTSSLFCSLFSSGSSSDSVDAIVQEGPTMVLKKPMFVLTERTNSETLARVEDLCSLSNTMIDYLNRKNMLVNKRKEIASLDIKTLKPGPITVLKKPMNARQSYFRGNKANFA